MNVTFVWTVPNRSPRTRRPSCTRPLWIGGRLPHQTATDEPLDRRHANLLTTKEMSGVHRSALHGSTRAVCAIATCTP